MDFLGVSDHNHYQAGMKTPADYHAGVIQATEANEDGTFVSLYGMEWGVLSSGGHVLVYGMDSLIGWDMQQNGITPDYDIYCAEGNYVGLWDIVAARNGAFCSLCHPENTDFGKLIDTTYSTIANQVITGTVFRSGAAFSTTTDYSDAPATSHESYYKKLLAKGYHVAPGIDHDNHYTTFGRTNMGRTVVLANSLTRSNILDALRSRRYYASDDWNTQVTFTVGGHYMGDIATLYENSNISVSVYDPDAGDTVTDIWIYYGIPGSGTSATILKSVTGSATHSYTHTTAEGNVYYYYARIRQADGNIIVTAPVWVTRSNTVLPAEGLVLTAEEKNKEAFVNWQTDSESGVDFFEIEKSYDGLRFSTIGKVKSLYGYSSSPCYYSFTDQNTLHGTQFYRLKIADIDGRYRYSEVRAVTIRKPGAQLLALYPNPASDKIMVRFSAGEKTTGRLLLYNSDGRQVAEQFIVITEGINEIQANITSLPAGYYYLVILKPGSRLIEFRFMKQ